MKNSEKLRVLVVDDDPAYRQLAQDSLSGHEKWIAGTAHEGVDLYHQFHPDICFLDLSLPDDNGLEMLLEIREDTPEAFVVMLTTSRLTEDVMMAQRCKANGYITKPFSRKQLRESCEACAKHWDKIDDMNEIELAVYRERMREDVTQMQKVLHVPTPETKAALDELMPRWNVLVVGERKELSQKWEVVLGGAGCQVTRAKSGGEAIALLNEKPFRLLLTEDTLTDIDASELLYRMRINRLTLPAIVVVDEEWKKQQTKWRKVGANRVLVAPIASEKLRMLVEKEVARSLHEVSGVLLQM